MPAAKQYASLDHYEGKLQRVAERLGVSNLDWNADRHGCWVSFTYKGQVYRFDHSVTNARNHGIDLTYGSDAFAQVVLALEDLSRMVERGIYDLQTWVSGLKYLPAPRQIPECFRLLGFVDVPTDKDAVSERYRQMAKVAHPDAGGNAGEFQSLQRAYQEAMGMVGGADDAGDR